jgi:uncharacterized damage-inducible protein DinB
MPEVQRRRGHAAAIRLQAAVEELLSEVDRLPADLINWKPAEGVWSVMDILCHVEEFVPYWTRQASGVVRTPGIAWGRDHTDKDRLAAVHDTATRRLADVRQAIRLSVRESADVLERMSDADLDVESASRNPRWGVKPARFIVDDLLVQHVEKHLGQVRRNVSQCQHQGPHQ